MNSQMKSSNLTQGNKTGSAQPDRGATDGEGECYPESHASILYRKNREVYIDEEFSQLWMLAYSSCGQRLLVGPMVSVSSIKKKVFSYNKEFHKIL